MVMSIMANTFRKYQTFDCLYNIACLYINEDFHSLVRGCSFSDVKDFPQFAQSFKYNWKKSFIAHVLSNSIQFICIACSSAT